MMEELSKCQDGIVLVLVGVGLVAFGFALGYACGKVEGMY